MNNAADFNPEPDTLTARLHSAISDRTRMQHLLVCLVGVLICVGVLLVQSASLTSRPSEQDSVFLGRHLVYLALSLACAWVASNISAEWLQRHAVRMYVALLILLVLLLVPGIGSRIYGAQRWLRFSRL